MRNPQPIGGTGTATAEGVTDPAIGPATSERVTAVRETEIGGGEGRQVDPIRKRMLQKQRWLGKKHQKRQKWRLGKMYQKLKW